MENIFDGFISSEDGKPIPHPREPIIDENEPKDVIFFDGRIFEIYGKEIDYLANKPQLLEERLKLAKDKGMIFMYPDGGYGCHYCEHYGFNVRDMASTGEAVVHNKNEKLCTYGSDGKIKWAIVFKNKEDGTRAICQRKTCIVNEATIEVLVNNGKLDEHEVFGKEFDYPTLEEMDRLYQSGSLPEKFIIKKPSLFKKLKNYFLK